MAKKIETIRNHISSQQYHCLIYCFITSRKTKNRSAIPLIKPSTCIIHNALRKIKKLSAEDLWVLSGKRTRVKLFVLES